MVSFLKSVLSILLGGGLAFVLAILCRDYQVKRAVPAIFVVVLVLIAQLAGRMASLLTALVGGLIFAVHLFEPYGNLAVGSAADRMILYMLRLGRLSACLRIS
jgi:K+-sensing histidine kinase KdpD